MPAALAGAGVTTFAEDASRQPQQYSLGAALAAPRDPSNIYYNARTGRTTNEYNTLYVAQGASLGPHLAGGNRPLRRTTATTCGRRPPTEADLFASESHIMLSHVLDNDPRVGYAHQTNLIGPAPQRPGLWRHHPEPHQRHAEPVQLLVHRSALQMTDVSEARCWPTRMPGRRPDAPDR